MAFHLNANKIKAYFQIFINSSICRIKILHNGGKLNNYPELITPANKCVKTKIVGCLIICNRVNIIKK